MTARRVASAAASAALALALLGAAGAASGQDPNPVAGKSAAANVNIRGLAFHPGKLTVNRGTKVVFANRDSVTHTATRSGGFATGRIAPGTSASVRFKTSGTFPYHCTIHSFMHGKIVVR